MTGRGVLLSDCSSFLEEVCGRPRLPRGGTLRRAVAGKEEDRTPGRDAERAWCGGARRGGLPPELRAWTMPERSDATSADTAL